MPTTHSSYMKRFGKQVDVLGTWYDQADSGLAVPDYVDAQSIGDLKIRKGSLTERLLALNRDLESMVLRKTMPCPAMG